MTIRYEQSARNVLGGELEPCSMDPVTGFYRNGCCETGPEDTGQHTVCAIMTDEFLRFSMAAGNDLSTPRPEFGFKGPAPRRPLVRLRAPLEGSAGRGICRAGGAGRDPTRRCWRSRR